MRRDGGTAREIAALRVEVEKLRAERDEAVETLRAIREGEVDAIIVSGGQGDQVFSLTGSESVYRLIVETMKEAALTVTTDGRILFCNAQFGAFVQTPPEQILGHALAEFVAPDQRAMVASLLVRSQEGSVKHRLVFQGPGRYPVPAHVSATALCQTDSLSICIVATDLTELEASTDLLRLLRTEQAALRASEERYRDLVELSPDPILVHCEGRYVYVNPAGVRLFAGRGPDDVVGRDVLDLVHPEDRRLVTDRIRQVLEHGVVTPLVGRRILRLDGRPVDVEATACGVTYHGQPAVQVIFRDITQRKQAESTLRTTLQRFYVVLSSMYSAVLLVSDEGRVEFANQAFCDQFGLTDAPADLVGLAARDMVAKIKQAYRHSKEAVARIRAILERNQPVRGEELAMSDGRTCLRDYVPLLVEGQSYGRLWLHVDISERKRAEEALTNLNATLEQKVSDRTAKLAETVEALQREVAQRQQAEAQLQRTNRALRMLSECNEALVRIDDEPRLMQEICRIAVEVGAYRMAWVGVAESDADQSVRPVASTGFEAGYLEAARITWADTERGRGPTGTAIRLNQVQIGTDFLTEPRLTPWRAEALKRGFRSSIALPLRQGEGVLGALTIYASEPAAFPEAQVKVLLDLAEDLAFGIHAVRVRTALRESRDRLRALAAELTLAEQRERRRLADVLHDGLQQLLVATRLRAHLLKRSPDAEAQAGAHEVVALLEEAIAQTRSLSRELSPPALQQGHLLPALEWLVSWMGEKHKLTVHVRPVTPPLPTLTVEIAVLLYQAVRELLLNVVKHAQVAMAEATLTPADTTLTCTVADVGVGFDPTNLRVVGGTEGGFGLLGIRERLELLGGHLAIESAPGQGSRFTITVPLGATSVSGSSAAAAPIGVPASQESSPKPSDGPHSAP